MKKNQIVLVVFVTLLVIAGLVSFYFYKKANTAKSVTATNQQNVTSQNTTNSSPQTQTNPAPAVAATLYYPMTNFANRITFRTFGQLVRSIDVASPCGASFSGYHDADDLEVTSAEVSTEVPVYAIADGTVREVGPVSGYGGLLVLGATIKGQAYTVYYGHIDLGSVTVGAGAPVKAGQKLANLGAQCSSQTSGERKHLHFAIHAGTAIDVRGYVPNLGVLASWVDPKVFLPQNSAANMQ